MRAKKRDTAPIIRRGDCLVVSCQTRGQVGAVIAGLGGVALTRSESPVWDVSRQADCALQRAINLSMSPAEVDERIRANMCGGGGRVTGGLETDTPGCRRSARRQSDSGTQSLQLLPCSA